MTTFTIGDVVNVRSGKYLGSHLTFVGTVAGWSVCLNDNEVGGFVRVRRVEWVRPGVTVFDPARHDRVFFNDFIRRLQFAAQCTGLPVPADLKLAD